MTIDACTQAGQTDLLRYDSSGALLTSQPLPGQLGVLGLSADGGLFTAYLESNVGTHIEERSPVSLGVVGSAAFFQPHVVPQDLVVTPDKVVLIGFTASIPTPPKLPDGGWLFPPYQQRTFITELDSSTLSLQRSGYLDANSNTPRSAGSIWAFGRVWVSGTCQNADGGFCHGPRNAFLMGLVP